MYETIQYMNVDGVATITLARPDTLNAFNRTMNREITAAVKEAGKDNRVRCLVFTGAGRGFCSGQDLSDVDENMDHGQVLREQYGPMMKQIMSLEKPVVAAVNGVAAGAGFSLALACDFRLASEKSSFVNAFINVGLIPDSGNLYYLAKSDWLCKSSRTFYIRRKNFGRKSIGVRSCNEGNSNRIMG